MYGVFTTDLWTNKKYYSTRVHRPTAFLPLFTRNFQPFSHHVKRCISPLCHLSPTYFRSSAKDQLTGASVAVKKIMKPFSTPVLAKRTYRELKLLKHIQHENIISLSDVFISPLEDIYFVTELLGTDLHRLLTSRPLEKQFIQYFLYQILVSPQFLVSLYPIALRLHNGVIGVEARSTPHRRLANWSGLPYDDGRVDCDLGTSPPSCPKIVHEFSSCWYSHHHSLPTSAR